MAWRRRIHKRVLSDSNLVVPAWTKRTWRNKSRSLPGFGFVQSPEKANYAVLRREDRGLGQRSSNYRQVVDGRLLRCLLAETQDAFNNIAEVCAVPGIGAMFKSFACPTSIAMVRQATIRTKRHLPPSSLKSSKRFPHLLRVRDCCPMKCQSS